MLFRQTLTADTTGAVRGVSWMVASSMFYALIYVVVRGLAEKFDVNQIVFFRAVLGSAFMLPWLFAVGISALADVEAETVSVAHVLQLYRRGGLDVRHRRHAACRRQRADVHHAALHAGARGDHAVGAAGRAPVVCDRGRLCRRAHNFAPRDDRGFVCRRRHAFCRRCVLGGIDRQQEADRDREPQCDGVLSLHADDSVCRPRRLFQLDAAGAGRRAAAHRARALHRRGAAMPDTGVPGGACQPGRDRELRAIAADCPARLDDLRSVDRSFYVDRGCDDLFEHLLCELS